MSESTKPTLNEAENGNKSKPLLAVVTDRDKDVLELCQKVIDIGAIYEYNSNSYDATRCPFCTGFEYHDRGSMDTIEHDNDCAWLLAKDLSTGLL